MTRNGWPSRSTLKSRIDTMCGWRSRAQARLSRMNRSRGPGAPAVVGPNDLDGDFVAEQRAPRAIHRAHPASASGARIS